MLSILYCGIAGASAPTQAVLPFVAAIGTVKSGHQAQIALAGDAVAMLKDGIAEHVTGQGRPPFSELLQSVQALRIPIYICAGCSAARGVSDADLQGKYGQLITTKDFEALCAASDWVLPVAPTGNAASPASECGDCESSHRLGEL
jgi:predicted peroxiredoxin